MTMHVTETDRSVLHADSVRRIASLVHVEDQEQSPEVLLGLIRSKDAEAWSLLSRFLAAWDEWFNFHRSVEADGLQGRLSSVQLHTLHSLVAAKNAARTALIQKTRSLELRRITIRVPVVKDRSGDELQLASRVRRDLYSHGPIELDPDAPEFSSRRDSDGSVFFSFVTAHAAEVQNILNRFNYTSPRVECIVEPAGTSEPCLNCGKVYEPSTPAVCVNCGFREISPCPRCGTDIARSDYIKIVGNLFRCPACAARVRLRYNDPIVDEYNSYNQPLVIVEEAD